jgi:Xaa-Pro aminopeptidase
MLADRRVKILHLVSKLHCDAIVAFRPENAYYLTGFWGESVAICTRNSSVLIVPRLEARRAEKTAKSCEVIASERGKSIVLRVLSEIGRRKTCSDCDDYSVIEIMLNNLSKGSLVINSEPFSVARMIKDKHEINMIAKACEIIDKLYEICVRELRPAQSESALQAILVYEALRLGANLISYRWSTNPIIVASGRNSSYPHAEVTGRSFSKNDIIVVDLTIRYNGYIGDATRTFFVGRPTARLRKVYNIVKNAQQAGIEALSSPQLSGNIDRASRTVIEKAGYGDDFIHSTGHGVGLEVHERPWIRFGDEERIRGNMVVTVEPGIYLENKFGVRIEDTLVVKNIAKGEPPESLTSYPKEIIEI